MSTEETVDFYEKIKQFQQDVLAKPPAFSEMVQEIRMMNFKIRPIYGDLSQLDFQNKNFIDALWCLGKVDQFFRAEFASVPDSDRHTFLNLVDEIRWNFQKQLNEAKIFTAPVQDDSRSVFELEIYKDLNDKAN